MWRRFAVFPVSSWPVSDLALCIVEGRHVVAVVVARGRVDVGGRTVRHSHPALVF